MSSTTPAGVVHLAAAPSPTWGAGKTEIADNGRRDPRGPSTITSQLVPAGSNLLSGRSGPTELKQSPLTVPARRGQGCEGPLAAVGEALGHPVAFGVAHPLADAITLVFGHRGRRDRDDQLADAVAGEVAAEIDHVQRYLVILELFERAGRVAADLPDRAWP